MAEKGRRLAGPEDLRADECAIDEQGELASQFIGASNCKLFSDTAEPVAHFPLMSGGDLARGMIGLGEFGSDVNLRAAAVVGPVDTLTDPFQMSIQFGGGVAGVLRSDTIPGSPEIGVLALEEGGDEIVLGSEMAVEAGFGDAGLFNDEIDTDCAYAALVEERAGGIEDSVSHFGVVLGHRLGRRFRHGRSCFRGILA